MAENKIKCKCGGELIEERKVATFESEAYVVGRCVVCKKPWDFSPKMWEDLNA